MRSIFYPKASDDSTPPEVGERGLKEAKLESQLICYECEREKADSWWRLIGVSDNALYREFLLGPKCRIKFMVEKPEIYGVLRAFGSEYECAPI